MQTKKRIVFMGTPSYATTILRGLIDNQYEIIAIFTQPDKKAGRGQSLVMPNVKQFVKDNSFAIPLYQPEVLDCDETLGVLKQLKPDFIVVAAYGQLLSVRILEVAPCINLHASILPKYRGASPIQEAILHNDQFTGVTAMLMEKGLDSGPILGYKYCVIDKHTTTETLFETLSLLASELIVEIFDRFIILFPKVQNSTQASYCKKILKNNGLINFVSAKKIDTMFRAYIAWPGVYLQSGLKINQCKKIDDEGRYKGGKILEIKKNSIVVGCQKGSLEITLLQAPSKRSINAAEYLRGMRLSVGDILG